ncbi:dTDP-4-dehydrorhamnose reductase [Thiomicrospira sp.]|uniref:dTDP-4-dehydrorhamnose reductase n=1 Tax=Thiomicrospira sp. TaxID=935 RepID=UPI002F9337BC
MIKRILVTGKSGQLGQSIQKLAKQYPQFDFQFVGRDELDLSQPNQLKTQLNQWAFDAIINCAAYTAVDKAETETELADAINHRAVGKLAQIAKDRNVFLIHVSTDYVFNGRHFKPYAESDEVEPQNVYGDSKLKGEQAIRIINPSAAIVRTSWVYSEFGNNFVKTMLRLGQERDQLNVIFDQVGTPTYATDLAKALLQICEQQNVSSNKSGTAIYHFSNEGVCAWYDFAKTIFELSGISCDVSPIETKDYPTPAKRPHYSVLNKAKIKQDFALAIPYWKDSLKACLLEIEKNDAK